METPAVSRRRFVLHIHPRHRSLANALSSLLGSTQNRSSDVANPSDPRRADWPALEGPASVLETGLYHENIQMHIVSLFSELSA